MKWALAFLGCATTFANPYTPSTDSTVVHRLSHHWASLSRNQIHKKCDALRAHPTDMRLAMAISDELMEEARVTSDPRPLGRVEAMMRPWWNIASPPPETLFLRARVRRADRRYKEALADLDELLRVQPLSWQARFLRATVLMSLGRVPEARTECEKLTVRADRLFAALCAARVDSSSGKATEAFKALKSAITKDATGNPAVNSWSRATLAQIAIDAGLPDEAKKNFTESLTWDPEDNETKANYAEFLIERHQAADAVGLLKADEGNPRLLLRLAIAEKEAKGPEMLRHVDALEKYFAELRGRGTPAPSYEEALFALYFEKNPKRALKLALANWDKARDGRDARLVREAAGRAGDAKALEVLK